MSKFKFYFIVLSSVLTLFSCNKADDLVYEPLHFYAPQYETDLATIEDYLKHNYIEQIVDHPGFPDDQDIKISKIPSGNTTFQALWDSPLLHSKEVLFNNLTYKVYYLQLREGDATLGESPTPVDQILISYDGSYMSYDSSTSPKTAITTRFEYVQFPEAYFNLNSTVEGWKEIIPLFKSGTLVPGEGPNPTVYNNFGAGVMFIPSALAYYNAKQTTASGVTIPSYSPLIFSFKLYDVKEIDQDGDGIMSRDEDVNHDGIYTNDDTDGDGIQNYADIDDDGDGYLTKDERKFTYTNPQTNEITVYYYSYNGAAEDDPATPNFDETQGVPDCSGNFNSPDRLRRYLDPNCHQ